MTNNTSDLAKKIRLEFSAATQASRKSLKHAIACGKLLLQAKAQLKHGGWIPFLKEECKIPVSTVSHYMRLAKGESQIANISNLTQNHASRLLQEKPSRIAFLLENNNGWTDGEPRIEWYTPEKYIAMARKVLGTIDLDPASCEFANGWIKATKIFTKNDNGLTKPWKGNVWCNPPYCGSMSQFVDKMCSEDFNAGIMLTNVAADARWFHNLLAHCDSYCLMRGRISFIAPDGISHRQNIQPQAFFYFGEKVKLFDEVFSEIGTCCKTTKVQKAKLKLVA